MMRRHRPDVTGLGYRFLPVWIALVGVVVMAVAALLLEGLT